MYYDTQMKNRITELIRKWAEESGLVLEGGGENYEKINIRKVNSWDYMVIGLTIESAYFWIDGYRKGISQ